MIKVAVVGLFDDYDLIVDLCISRATIYVTTKVISITILCLCVLGNQRNSSESFEYHMTCSDDTC